MFFLPLFFVFFYKLLFFFNKILEIKLFSIKCHILFKKLKGLTKKYYSFINALSNISH